MNRISFSEKNEEKKPILIIYDISSSKRRNKISKLLEGYGTRVQLSAFEIWINGSGIKNIWNDIYSIIDEKEDIVNLYFLNHFEKWSFGADKTGRRIDIFIA